MRALPPASAPRTPSIAVRLTVGALLGVCVWVATARLLPFLPVPARFFLTWLIFTFGSGAACGAYLTRDLDALRRAIVLLGFGTVATPILIEALGRTHMLAVYPYVAFGLAGVGLALWRQRSSDRSTPVSPADLVACVALVALVAAMGAVVFWHRLITTADGILVNGAYDSVDLSFYAAWAAEASHTVPPTASYYAGHQLNAAYYPQLVLAMVHRFAAVPMLPIYFRYAWPTFLALGALTAFVLVRSLASRGTALLTVVLILLGGDFSYLAAWFLPHATFQWDYLLWPTNFLSATMEVLQFNTWAQSLPVFFTALYAIVRGLETRSRGWLFASALVLATLFQFKPFAYIVLMAGLSAAALFSGRDRATRWRLVATIVLTVILTLPFVYTVLSIHEDHRSKLLIDFFLLPQRMLIKLDLTDAFLHAAKGLAPIAALGTPIFLALATILFFAVGPGVRWFGVPGVWRAIRGSKSPDAPAWRLLGWIVVAGAGIPFVLATDPYVDTLQFYQTGLYVLWIFAALALTTFLRTHRALGAAAIAAAIALALPSSLHFLEMKWTDNQRPPLATLSNAELRFGAYLQTCDPESTVVLHDHPLDPSLMAVVSDRRVVLSWGPKYYAVGSESRMRDVDAFYASAGGDAAPALDTLARYHVTHVIVHEGRDRVHPDVLTHLQVLMRFPDATLYATALAGATTASTTTGAR